MTDLFARQRVGMPPHVQHRNAEGSQASARWSIHEPRSARNRRPQLPRGASRQRGLIVHDRGLVPLQIFSFPSIFTPRRADSFLPRRHHWYIAAAHKIGWTAGRGSGDQKQIGIFKRPDHAQQTPETGSTLPLCTFFRARMCRTYRQGER